MTAYKIQIFTVVCFLIESIVRNTCTVRECQVLGLFCNNNYENFIAKTAAC